MSEIHIGIDPDQKGALVALSSLPKLEPISILRMPLIKVEGKPQMNTRAIVNWVLELFPHKDCHVWLEKCPKYAVRIQTMRSQAIHYGRFIGLFEGRFPHMVLHRTACGQELAGWQRAFLGRFTAETSEELALARAREIWPHMKWPEDQNGKPYSGVIDAALIAEFGRRKTNNEEMPFPPR